METENCRLLTNLFIHEVTFNSEKSTFHTIKFLCRGVGRCVTQKFQISGNPSKNYDFTAHVDHKRTGPADTTIRRRTS